MNPLLKSAASTLAIAQTLKSYAKLTTARLRKAPRQEIADVYQGWSKNVFRALGYRLENTGERPLEEPCIYVGNHVSFLDIPLVWTAAEGAYVSKKEIARWPVIGPAATVLGTIYVDRSSLSSRAGVLESLKSEILENKKRVCIFPEGTTSVEGIPWKWGAFRLAADFGIPVQPFRIFYCPLRDSAYVDEDSLHGQLWKLLGSPQKIASIDWGKPQQIKDFKADAQAMEQWVRKSFNARRSLLNCG